MSASVYWADLRVEDVHRQIVDLNLSDRKCRLFGVACCRSREETTSTPLLVELLELAEAFADSAVTRRQLQTARIAVRRWSVNEGGLGVQNMEDWLRRYAVWNTALPNVVPPRSGFFSMDYPGFRLFADDVFGNPARPVVFDPTWQTDTAVSLAKYMYESRDFSPMPILADALQDAGCDSEDVLNHCRDEKQMHVRGCWVVDLVLGKT